MPGGDRTGPNGMGSMTGRKAGICAGYPEPGFMNNTWGRGGGRRWGRGGGDGGRGGWGRRLWSRATGMTARTKEEELAELESQARYIAQELEKLHERISEVKSSAEGTKTT